MTYLKWIPTPELLLAPRLKRGRRLYPNDNLYVVTIEFPNGAIEDREVMASDSDEAGELVAEQLMEDERVDFDTAATWISPAVRVPRFA